MADRSIPLGDYRLDGEASCGYGLPVAHCGERATRHVLWLADHANILCCEQHFREYVIPRIQPGECDFHAFGGVCAMPGALWKYSEGGHEGFCVFELPESIDLSEELELTR